MLLLACVFPAAASTQHLFGARQGSSRVLEDAGSKLPMFIIRTNGEKLFEEEMILTYARDLEGVASVLLLHHHHCYRRCYDSEEDTRKHIEALVHKTNNLEALTYGDSWVPGPYPPP